MLPSRLKRDALPMTSERSGPEKTTPSASQAESLIERTLLAARWILIVFYFGLALALALYAIAFINKCIKLTQGLFALSDNEVILAMLGLIDACLVASLMVMVMLTGYENYISRLEHEKASELAWLGKIDTGSLKVKIASSIVAISSIHLLQIFLNTSKYNQQEIMWATIIHLVFVISAFMLAVLDRITPTDKPKEEASGSE
jgi:uncharacterized protein (TIGR00645 family)